jgi:DNA-binding response OmpR family regulator
MQKKVLVVDDDQYLRELYEEILQEENFLVETAQDGEEGLTKLQAGGYNLVLLDLMLPKRDGLDILKALVQQPSLQKNGPILLLTNLGYEKVLQQALQLGAQAYVNKADMTPDQLLEMVKKYLA